MPEFERENTIYKKEDREGITYVSDAERARRGHSEFNRPGEMPQCLLTQTDPKGVVTGPATVVLEGTGQWLTPKENPCQTYLPEKQITIGFGMMYIGGSVVIYDPEDHSGNRAELMPTCTEIEVYAA